MSRSSSSNPSQLLSRGSEILAYVLLGQFLLIVSGSFLPPQPLDVDWQLALAGNLVDNGAYPLLALFLITFASFINADDEGLETRQLRMRRLACLAAVAYLLLAPLQVAICRVGFSQAGTGLRRQADTATRAINDLRKAIDPASSTQELQANLRRIQAPPLPAEVLQLPLPEIKSSMIAQLEGRRSSISENLRQPLIKRLWPTFQKAMRNTLASLVLAVGFAAMAVPKGASVSLLQQWIAAFTGIGNTWSNLRRRLHVWREERQEKAERARRTAQVKQMQRNKDKQETRGTFPFLSKPRIHDQDYFDAISRDPSDPPSSQRPPSQGRQSKGRPGFGRFGKRR
ncbi:MAG: HpsJ family protein [Synechococcaceae cyanobacterium]|nr:HpsJ family protein [Synechococcaceae cyanobacterium]